MDPPFRAPLTQPGSSEGKESITRRGGGSLSFRRSRIMVCAREEGGAAQEKGSLCSLACLFEGGGGKPLKIATDYPRSHKQQRSKFR